jgi:hypothetical protein
VHCCDAQEMEERPERSTVRTVDRPGRQGERRAHLCTDGESVPHCSFKPLPFIRWLVGMALCSATPRGAPWAYADKVSAAAKIRYVFLTVQG